MHVGSRSPAEIIGDSSLKLDFGFFADAGKVVLDVAGLEAREEVGSKNEIGIFRHDAPGDYADEEYAKQWDRRVQRAHPFDAIAEPKGNSQRISTIYGKPGSQPESTVLYTFYVESDRSVAQETMKAKLDLLMKNARITER